jgi:Galactosyltransferase
VIPGHRVTCSMLPRKSTVLRYLFLAPIVVTAVLWLTIESSGDVTSSWGWKLDSDSLLSSNETELRKELLGVQLEFGDAHLLSISDNLTLSELRTKVVYFRRARPVNPHPFSYILNPHGVCNGGDVFLLVYIHSAPSHFKQRMAIRETWGNAKYFPDVSLIVVFLCGVIPSKGSSSVQDALMLEVETYGDIVQETFVDSYRNLTYKGIMGLKWVTQNCRNAKFLLKTDDDIFINMFSLVTHLKKIEAQRGGHVQNLLLCHVWNGMKVVRDPRSKWYLSPTEYPEDHFPTYCSGSAFILTTDVAGEMYKASFKVPFFWVDDVYVTGLLAKEVGVVHEYFNTVYVLLPGSFLHKFTDSNTWLTLIVGHCYKINQLKIVWNNVLAEQRRRKAITVKR